jgi:beta-lactamase class A
VEILKSSAEKLKKATAIGLASIALVMCSNNTETTSAEPVALMTNTLEVMCDDNGNSQLESDWRAIMQDRQGHFDVALLNSRTGQLTHCHNTNEQYYTASIVKLSILEKILILDQAAGHSLTAEEMQDAHPMITESDNQAAQRLWQRAGGTGGMQDFFDHNGAPSTRADTTGGFGLTETTALDQLAIVNKVAYSNTPLSNESVAVANDLMHQIIPGQRWGVSGGLPSDVTYELKDGWLPNTNCTINSIGHVHDGNEDYTFAVLTKRSSSMSDAIVTIEQLSAKAWADSRKA